MCAWLLPAYTDIPSLTLGTAPDPTPGHDQVILALKFAALNPADRYLSIGQYPAKPTFPHILGRDGVGTVLAVGSQVTGITPGDTRLILRSEVGVNKPGTLAENVAVEARYTVPIPKNWSLEQAAAAPLVYITAWQALTQWNSAPPPPGTRILITGASGGVGVASIQLAKSFNCHIIALSRSPEKSQQLRELGALATFDPQDKTWRDQCKEALGDHRIDLAIDNIGGELFNHLLEVMAMHGKISVVGRLGGPVPSFNTASLFFRRLRIGGVAIGTYTVEESHAAWTGVLAALEATAAHPLIDHIFDFEQVPQAFARLAQGPMGKVVIKIA